jgi:murein L,D-transpeptidase YcbB/YkuD
MRRPGFPWFLTNALGAAILVSLALARAEAEPDPSRAPDRTSAPDRTGAIVMARVIARGPLMAEGVMLDKDALAEFYAARDYAPAWSDAPSSNDETIGLDAKAVAIFDTLSAAETEGLEPADYHVREIAALGSAQTDVARANRDLLITDGLIRYATDVSAGRLTPQQTDERTSPREGLDVPRYLASAALLDPEAFAALLETLPPSTPEYRALDQMLASIRPLVEAGGWQPLPEGPTIHPGVHDAAVPALRLRLIAEHRIAPPAKPIPAANADLYDKDLAAAVAAFQAQHGIKPDGAIGKDTRAALDVPADVRLRQIVVNLERARWVDVPASGRMVEVNLAGYSLTVYQDGQPILAMPVVVGSADNQTPILNTRITTVVVNPNWTLPPKVIKEILPRIQADVDYLPDRGIARHESDGHVRLTQPPGPSNPLGHYKFVMPNDQDIYLHDSPDSAKFRYALRAYSHGCIRLGKPADLAALLLDDRVASLHTSLADMADTWQTHYVALSKPVPVTLVYRTAWLDANGRLVLGDDAYGRDARLWRALQKSHSTFVAPKKLAGSLSKGCCKEVLQYTGEHPTSADLHFAKLSIN